MNSQQVILINPLLVASRSSLPQEIAKLIYFFRKLAASIYAYKLQAVEICGELRQIIDLFVRINSTGKRLTSGEQRHAKFYNSPFLKAAEKLVSQFDTYLKTQKILSQTQIDRMKGVELFSELLISVQTGGPINKKTSLDRTIGGDSINGNTLHRISREVAQTTRRVKSLFPDLQETRFRNTAEFYSLFLLVWEMERERFVLTDRKRNTIALTLLRKPRVPLPNRLPIVPFNAILKVKPYIETISLEAPFTHKHEDGFKTLFAVYHVVDQAPVMVALIKKDAR